MDPIHTPTSLVIAHILGGRSSLRNWNKNKHGAGITMATDRGIVEATLFCIFHLSD